MFLDKIFGKGNKKEIDSFDSLFDDVNESKGNKSQVRQESKSNSFYGDEDDLGSFSDNKENNKHKSKKKGFYGFDYSDESKTEEKNLNEEIFNFAWWEYVVILIEFLMLIYVILLFAGVVSI